MNVGDLVRVTSWRYERDSLGIVIRKPSWRTRFMYEIATLNYPDGCWFSRIEFYKTALYLEYVDEIKYIIKKREKHMKWYGFKSFLREPRIVDQKMNPIYLVTEEIPRVMIWYEEERLPIMHVLFEEANGREALIRMDKAKYYHKLLSYKLNDEQAMVLDSILGEYDEDEKCSRWYNHSKRYRRNKETQKYFEGVDSKPDYTKLK